MALRTFSGKLVNPFDLHPDAIDICDIAHHLSQTARYHGAGAFHYSVAQHCCILATVVPQLLNEAGQVADEAEFKLVAAAALLHDACEAYTPWGDMVAPCKVDLPKDFQTFVAHIEDDLTERIFAKFGIPFGLAEAIHFFDKSICENEKEALFPGQERSPSSYSPLPNVEITPWTCEMGERNYLHLFKVLVPEVVHHEH